jgi:hypothetical protein
MMRAAWLYQHRHRTHGMANLNITLSFPSVPDKKRHCGTGTREVANDHEQSLEDHLGRTVDQFSRPSQMLTGWLRHRPTPRQRTGARPLPIPRRLVSNVTGMCGGRDVIRRLEGNVEAGGGTLFHARVRQKPTLEGKAFAHWTMPLVETVVGASRAFLARFLWGRRTDSFMSHNFCMTGQLPRRNVGMWHK